MGDRVCQHCGDSVGIGLDPSWPLLSDAELRVLARTLEMPFNVTPHHYTLPLDLLWGAAWSGTYLEAVGRPLTAGQREAANHVGPGLWKLTRRWPMLVGTEDAAVVSVAVQLQRVRERDSPVFAEWRLGQKGDSVTLNGWKAAEVTESQLLRAWQLGRDVLPYGYSLLPETGRPLGTVKGPDFQADLERALREHSRDTHGSRPAQIEIITRLGISRSTFQSRLRDGGLDWQAIRNKKP